MNDDELDNFIKSVLGTNNDNPSSEVTDSLGKAKKIYEEMSQYENIQNMNKLINDSESDLTPIDNSPLGIPNSMRWDAINTILSSSSNDLSIDTIKKKIAMKRQTIALKLTANQEFPDNKALTDEQRQELLFLSEQDILNDSNYTIEDFLRQDLINESLIQGFTTREKKLEALKTSKIFETTRERLQAEIDRVFEHEKKQQHPKDLKQQVLEAREDHIEKKRLFRKIMENFHKDKEDFKNDEKSQDNR